MMNIWHLKIERKKTWNKALKAPLTFRETIINNIHYYFRLYA